MQKLPIQRIIGGTERRTAIFPILELEAGPAVSATVYSIREDSREFTPSSTRQRNYQVFWMEFLVVLDLPQSQCPGSMVPLTSPEPQCTGTVKTPEVKSRADAIDWGRRHSRGSKVIVHYDPQSERMTFAGESIFNIYPWNKITVTAVILICCSIND